MYILPLLGYTGLLLGFAFLTLSIASGLYYLSELVEEHSVQASRVLHRLVYAVAATQLLLAAVDRLPWLPSLLGVVSHAVYARNLRHFPIVRLSDPTFIASCVLVILNHWVWFRYFSEPPSYSSYSSYSSSWTGQRSNAFKDRYSSSYNDQPTFTEIASYFGLCVWLVPFALFVSLSAGENVLPSMGSEYATGERAGVGSQAQQQQLNGSGVGGGGGGGGSSRKGHRRRNTGMAKAAVAGAREWVGETGAVMGLWRHENVRSSFD